MIKKLLTLAAVASLTAAAAASPALARSTYNNARNANATWQDSFGQVRPFSPNAVYADPNAVYVDGTYAGSDPDPRVRLQIQRDYYEQRYGD